MHQYGISETIKFGNARIDVTFCVVALCLAATALSCDTAPQLLDDPSLYEDPRLLVDIPLDSVDYLVGKVAAAVLDPTSEEIYIADGYEQVIHVVDRNGRELRTIGRKGSGPGEFGALTSIGWVGGVLLALDPGNGRLSSFSDNGSLLESWTNFPLQGSPTDVRIFPGGDGAAYVRSIAYGEQGIKPVYVLTSREGPQDTLSKPATDGAPGVWCRESGGGIGFLDIEWLPADIVVPAPGMMFAATRSDEHAIYILREDGDTAQVVWANAAPVPLADAEWEDSEAAYKRFRRLWPGARCDQMPRRPRFKPMFRRLYFSQEGLLVAELNRVHGTVLHYYSESGAIIRRTRMPARDRSIAPDFRGNQILLVAADSMGNQRLQVWTGP
jgi:hypothetical protein